MKKFCLLVLAYDEEENEVYELYQSSEKDLGKFFEKALEDPYSGEFHRTLNSIEEYVERVETGLLPNVEYTFYHNGDGISLLLNGYELGIADCVAFGSGRG